LKQTNLGIEHIMKVNQPKLIENMNKTKKKERMTYLLKTFHLALMPTNVKTPFSTSNKRQKILKLSKFQKKLIFSSPMKGSLEIIRRRLLSFMTQENKKKSF